MIRSMTGYGRAQAVIETMSITVEIKSVNHRYFEFNSRVPRSYGFLEEKLKSYVGSRVSRGKVECYVSIENLEDDEVEILVNHSLAASYLNGKVVDSLGGGICQVSTTLYNAVLLAELDVTQRYNHSMIVAYVDPSADAAIAESAGKDFKFVNNTDAPIYIEGIIKNKKITVNIYGKETRDNNREVIYESEIISRTPPGQDVIYVDAGRPIGYIVKESAHVGYKARLWKVVKENGEVVERTQVNSSTYKMTPRYATVGVSTADPNAYNEIMCRM